MASILTSDDAARERNDRASGHGIVLAGDRTRQFRRARWHSITVRSLRVGLPLLSIGLVVAYVGSILQTAGYGQKDAPPTIAPVIDKDFAMDNPRYEGFTKDGGSFTVLARTALPDLKNPAVVTLKTITGELFDARRSRTDLTATRGVFDSKANQLDLKDGITIVTQTGMKAELTSATLMTKDGTLTSREGVRVEMPTAVITSTELMLNQKTREIAFIDQVVARLTPSDKPVSAAAPGARDTKSAMAFGNSKTPVDVIARRLDVNDGAKTARFSGAVKASQGIAQIETEALEVSYSGQAGVAPAAATEGGAPATKIERIVAPGPVVLTQGTGDRVTGSSAIFDAVAETAVVAGNVVMTSGADRRATSERAEFQQRTETIKLSGNVIVTQARNEMRGRQLVVDRLSGKTELSSPAEGGLARSRIFARLYQGDRPGAKAAAGAAAGAAGFATFKTDPNAPVDIEADRLNVEDAKKEATFTGDVKAAQGDFIIRTIALQAFYSGEAGLMTANAAAASGQPRAAAQLTRIEAKGKVVVTSKADQRVTGDWAIFDTKANTVTVGGADVILTQDKNIVQGNKLTIDMATGLSTIVREAQAGSAAAKPGRSSVVFYPQDRPGKGAAIQGKPDAAPRAVPPVTPPKPAASSWEASSQPAD